MSVKDTDLLQGPVPEQWKPENQDPSVAYTVDEMTGIRTPLVVETVEEDDAPKKKGRAKKDPEPEVVVEETLAAEEPPVEPEPEPEPEES